MIGVVGAYGAVGRAAAAMLHDRGTAPLRLGGRDPRRLDALAVPGERMAVDVRDAAALRAFCAGCGVVVNCAGPSCDIRDTVGRAASAVGAGYVDIALEDAAVGDAASGGAVSVTAAPEDGTVGDGTPEEGAAGNGAAGKRAAPPARTAWVVAAGMTPGLSSLLPRHLAGVGPGRPVRLTAYTGGLDRFTPAAAADYVASMRAGHGTALAAWRGQVVPRALAPLRDVALPGFAGRADAHPYLSGETERLARALGLAEVRWYNVFDSSAFGGGADGGGMAAALARVRDAAPGDAAAELERASRLATFGRTPYQQMTYEMTFAAAEGETTRTLSLRAADAYELSAAVAVAAAEAVLAGRVPPGVHEAAEVLPPAATYEEIRRLPAVVRLDVSAGPPAASVPVEEGTL